MMVSVWLSSDDLWPFYVCVMIYESFWSFSGSFNPWRPGSSCSSFMLLVCSVCFVAALGSVVLCVCWGTSDHDGWFQISVQSRPALRRLWLTLYLWTDAIQTQRLNSRWHCVLLVSVSVIYQQMNESGLCDYTGILGDSDDSDDGTTHTHKHAIVLS